jgi:hypothetical protein
MLLDRRPDVPQREKGKCLILPGLELRAFDRGVALATAPSWLLLTPSKIKGRRARSYGQETAHSHDPEHADSVSLIRALSTTAILIDLHPASYPTGTSGRSVKLTTHSAVVKRSGAAALTAWQ